MASGMEKQGRRVVRRAETYDEIKPLVELCKAGKLFEVQEWIAAGKPVEPPLPESKKSRRHTPLQYAIDFGFHSLVAVLLDGGADIENTSRYCPMNHAIAERRFDIVKLLVDHGVDPTEVDMQTVFYSWDADMMEYFTELLRTSAIRAVVCWYTPRVNELLGRLPMESATSAQVD